ncbi:hypothetical protein [Haloparvum sp. AD34]
MGVDVDLDDRESCNRVMDEHIRLCSATIQNGHAVLTFKADRLEKLTMIEAAPLESREYSKQEFVIRSDGRTEVRLPVDTSSGTVGVYVDTGERLHGIPIQESEPLIGGPWSATDSQASALGGATGVGVVAFLIVFRSIYGRTEEPERVA